MNTFERVFKRTKVIIGMIHVGALPGTPGYAGDMNRIIEQAVREARQYKDSGIDALAIENMHDIPYLNGSVGPEITAAMTIIGHHVKKETGLPCGVQILAAANKEALAAAFSAGLDFIRAEGFVFSHVADEGLINSCAGELLRYRKTIGADNILVFTDIKKKHSAHAITSDVDIAETAHAAEFFKSDGVIITGISTGAAANIEEIRAVKKSVSLPVLVGSGITLDNVGDFLREADALIVGSYFKTAGRWDNPLEPGKVKEFMSKVDSIR